MTNSVDAGLLCALAAVSLVSGCQRNVTAIWSAEVRSPDGRWIARARTERERGPGVANVTTAVYLAPTSSPQAETSILSFPDGPGNLDYIDLRMQRQTSTRLQISLREHPDFTWQVIRAGDIDISVSDLAHPTEIP